eukprot:SAG31_NODE_17633_length_663_cov_1.732270_1_plen_66_part_00
MTAEEMDACSHITIRGICKDMTLETLRVEAATTTSELAVQTERTQAMRYMELFLEEARQEIQKRT